MRGICLVNKYLLSTYYVLAGEEIEQNRPYPSSWSLESGGEMNGGSK